MEDKNSGGSPKPMFRAGPVGAPVTSVDERTSETEGTFVNQGISDTEGTSEDQGPRRLGFLIAGLVSAALAVLMAAGFFWNGGLDWAHLGLGVPTDWARWLVVMILALVAIGLFLVREYTELKSVAVGALVWGGTALSYFVVGALVLHPTTGPKMGLATEEAQARGLGVVTVIFFLIAGVLVLKAERDKVTEPRVSLTSILSLRTSPGSTVILLWSLVVSYALGIIAGTVIQSGHGTRKFECGDLITENCIQTGVWPSYLILLAVPGAAAAAVTMSSAEKKKTASQLAAITLGAAKKRAEDRLNTAGAARSSSDANEKAALERSKKLLDEAINVADSGDTTSTTTAITDIQYFVFNVFAMLFVLSALIPSGRLMEVPELLLALTGASALVYTVNRHTTT